MNTDLRPDVDIDQQTKDELRPPCEASRGDAPCPHPAKWATLNNCRTIHGSSGAYRLNCDAHLAALITGTLLCSHCLAVGNRNALEALSVEPLR